jgi:hypothetical protein
MAAALRAAGGVVHAVERVLTDQARVAFVCVRPPGHHAGTDGATAGAPSSGFSILNNAMIGTRDADASRRRYTDFFLVFGFFGKSGRRDETRAHRAYHAGALAVATRLPHIARGF